MKNEGLIRVNRGEYRTIEYLAVVRCPQRNVHIGNSLKRAGEKNPKTIFLLM